MQASPSRARETLALAALLLALTAATFGGVLFDGRSLVYTDNYNPLDPRLHAPSHGPDFVPESEWTARNLKRPTNVHDPGAAWWQWEPGAQFLRRTLAAGDLPLWDPHVAAGAPALANLTQSFFFPPYTAMVLLGNTSLLRNVYYLGLLLCAAACSYALLRRHGVTPVAAAAAAVAVFSCGGLNQNVGSLIGQTAACLPPALLLTGWQLARPTRRRTAALAVGYGAIALSSFPPLLVAVFGASGLYALVCFWSFPDAARRARRYALGAALGLGLAAFLHLPAFAAARLPQIATTYGHAGLQALPWPVLGQLLSPTLMGGAKVQLDPPMPDLFPAGVPYVGVVVLLLAGLARPAAGRRSRWLFATLLLAVVVLVAKLLGIEPVQSLARLPVLEKVHFMYYLGIPLSILVALLAGLGLDALVGGRTSLRRLLMVTGLLGVTLLGVRLLAVERGVGAHPHAAEWFERWRLVAIGLGAAAIVALPLCGRVASRRWLRVSLAGGLVLLAAAEGVLNNRYPRQRRHDLWRNPPPYVWQVVSEAGRGRVFNAAVFPANTGSAFGVDQLDSLMAFNPERIFRLYRRYAARGAYQFLRDARGLPPADVLAAANVELLAVHLIHDALLGEAEARGCRPLYADGIARLLRCPSEPRHYFTTAFRVVPTEQALEAVADRAPGEVVLEEDPGFRPAAVAGAAGLVPTAAGANHVELRFRAPRPGLVYVADSFSPGWTARVNGEEAPILPANYAFRAVRVPAGDVVVRLEYWPPGLALGLLLSLAAAVTAGFLVVVPERRPVPRLTEEQAPPRRALRPWAPRVALAAPVAVGLVAFVASGVPAAQLAAAASDATVKNRLLGQPSFYRVAWEEPEVPARLAAGAAATVRVTVRNAGDGIWLHPGAADPGRASGHGAVRLSSRWLDAAGNPLTEYLLRVDLPHSVAAGTAARLEAPVRAPDAPGDYQLQLDLVQESVTWFEHQGAATLVVPVEVTAAGVGP